MATELATLKDERFLSTRHSKNFLKSNNSGFSLSQMFMEVLLMVPKSDQVSVPSTSIY